MLDYSLWWILCFKACRDEQRKDARVWVRCLQQCNILSRNLTLISLGVKIEDLKILSITLEFDHGVWYCTMQSTKSSKSCPRTPSNSLSNRHRYRMFGSKQNPGKILTTFRTFFGNGRCHGLSPTVTPGIWYHVAHKERYKRYYLFLLNRGHAYRQKK